MHLSYSQQHCLCFALLLLCSTSFATDTKSIGGDFSLTDHNGQTYQLSQSRGKLVFLFFGYTSCPDVCPTELSILGQVFRKTNQQADQVQGLFVTVDPKRDTPDILKQYVGHFSEHIIGLTGSDSAIDKVAKQYHVNYQRHEKTGPNYSVDHTSNLYVIDKSGKLVTIIPYGLPYQHVMKILRDLLAKTT